MTTEDSEARARTEALRKEVELLRARVDELALSGAESETFEKRLELYGFMDMGAQRVWSGARAATTATGSPRALTFVLGNLNFYIDAMPTAGWRALTEVRITNYPDGALYHPAVPALGVDEDRGDTRVFDVTAPDPGWNEVRWGSIVLEQAWIQGTASDLLSVRLGYFLTPFGIWSIDHGTPTLIALNRPQFTRGRFYPDHQLGLQILGQSSVDAWTLAYVGYVSNGKTKGQLDMTDDKSFGGRVSLSTTRPVRLSLGLSGYGGRYGEVTTSSLPTDPLGVATKETIAYHQWDGGLDVSLDIDEFRMRMEAAIDRVEYVPGKREQVYNLPNVLWPDRTNFGVYLLAAYQLPWLGLEPYASGALFRFPTPLSEAAVIPSVGLNIHLSTEVQVKTEFASAHFFDFDGTNHSQHDTSTLAARLVLAF